MKSLTSYALAFLFALSPLAHADAIADGQAMLNKKNYQVNPGDYTEADIANSNRAAGLGIATTNEAQTAQQTLNTGTTQTQNNPTINQGAEKGEESQSSGSAMNMAAAAMLMAACLAPKPPALPLCAMGALAAMQGGHDAGAAKESEATYQASKADTGTAGNGGGAGGAGQTPTPGADTGSAGFDPNIKEGMVALENGGYKVTEDSVTFPDGSVKPSSVFNSAASMQAAGVDAGTAAMAAAEVDKINKKLAEDGPRMVSMAVDGAGGGGSSNPGAGGDSNIFSFNKPWGLSAADRRRMVEGKSVSLAGEPIGVKGDNLFDMVHRAYEKKRKTANFIENEGAVSVRMPASMAPASFKPGR